MDNSKILAKGCRFTIPESYRTSVCFGTKEFSPGQIKADRLQSWGIFLLYSGTLFLLWGAGMFFYKPSGDTPLSNLGFGLSLVSICLGYALFLLSTFLRFRAERAFLSEGFFCKPEVKKSPSGKKAHEKVIWVDPFEEWKPGDYILPVYAKALAIAVSRIKENRMPDRNEHLAVFACGLYLLWYCPYVGLPQFWVGFGLIFFELFRTSLFLFSKPNPIDLLKMNQNWQRYEMMIEPKKIEEVEKPIDRYTREESVEESVIEKEGA